MKKLILFTFLLSLTGCDLIKDLKYQYYYKYQGKIHCYIIETIKEEGEYATKTKYTKDPRTYTLSRLDAPEVDFVRQDGNSFTVKKTEETDTSIWLRDKKGSVEGTWVFTKSKALLTEIILEENDGVGVVINKFSCR